jgi:hypothetical protein
METCHKCGSDKLEWAGFTPRALKRMKPSRDVRKCTACGHTWYYASLGTRVTTRTFTVEILHGRK